MKKYFRHKLQNLINVNKIVTIHYFEFDKNFTFSKESHDFWEIVYVDKENFYCNVNGKEILLSEGEIIFHKPNVPHSHYADGKTAPNVFIISFECKSQSMQFFEDKKFLLDDKLKKFIYLIIDEAKKTFDIEVFNPNLRKLNLLKNPSLGGEQLLKNYLEIFLVDLLRNQTETKKGNSSFLTKNEYDNKFIDDVIKLLKSNVCYKVSIDDLCNSTAYSRAHLFREFKRVTGKTIMNYYCDLKMEKAKQLLREKEFSISIIAEKLNFDTPNYFSKTFKKKIGLTPLQYRKRFST